MVVLENEPAKEGVKWFRYGRGLLPPVGGVMGGLHQEIFKFLIEFWAL